MGIEVGARTTWERRVEAEMTADRWGNTTAVAGEGTHERVLIDLARFVQRVGAPQP